MPDMNADDTTGKLNETLEITRKIIQQFKNPVKLVV
jgi:hypothetical protein